MITSGLQVRPATIADHNQISDLLFIGPQTHRHMDWRAPLEWLGAPHYFVLEENGHIIAALACPQDPPGIAWIRLFTFASPLTGPEAWSTLWEIANAEIGSSGGAIAAIITTQAWMTPLLQTSKFYLKQNIVMLTLQGQLKSQSAKQNFNIRNITQEDLPEIIEVDWSAFEPLWRNSQDSTANAFSQSTYATLAEQDGNILGYQLSTQNPRGSHLARLAVRKEAQARGIGSALLNDLIRRLVSRQTDFISVNTQADNIASLHLYNKFGFVRTGEQYPVYIYEIRGTA